MFFFPLGTICEHKEQKLPDSQFDFEIPAFLFAKLSNVPVVEIPEVENGLYLFFVAILTYFFTILFYRARHTASG